VLTEFRTRIARLLALCVFVLTFGRVQVNMTGRPTVAGPGRDDTDFSATHVPESGPTSPPGPPPNKPLKRMVGRGRPPTA
jgi:hypothetical protein